MKGGLRPSCNWVWRVCLWTKRAPAEALGWARAQRAETAQQQRRPDDEAHARAVLAEALLAQDQDQDQNKGKDKLQPAEARTEIDRAVALVARSQAQITRLRVKISAARAEAALGHYSPLNSQRLMRNLAVAEARDNGEVSLALPGLRKARSRCARIMRLPDGPTLRPSRKTRVAKVSCPSHEKRRSRGAQRQEPPRISRIGAD